MPEVIIKPDAESYINTVSFNEDAYVNYLRNVRNMSENDIENISIVFTNNGVSNLAIANTSPGFLNDGNHIIRISPTRFPVDVHMQGRILRHETEHVIQGCNWQYKAWAAGQLSFIGATAIASGALFNHQVQEATEALPVPAQVALGSLAAIGGAAMGAIVATRIGKQLSLLEVSAMIAEKRYKSQLSDGVLQVTKR